MISVARSRSSKRSQYGQLPENEVHEEPRDALGCGQSLTVLRIASNLDGEGKVVVIDGWWGWIEVERKKGGKDWGRA